MFKKFACAAALAIVASSSIAAEGAGFYIGADVGSSKIDDFSKREGSFGAFAGMQFNQYFAAEVGYRNLATFEFSGVDLKVKQAAISAIGSVPLGGSGVSLFGRVGYNHVEVTGERTFNPPFGGRPFSYSVKDSTSGVLAGIGASFTFMPNLTGRLELQRPSSDSTNVSAGIAYKF